MSNPVLTVTHNALERTIACVESIRAQDIPTTLYIVDNGSTDDTKDYLASQQSANLLWFDWPENMGVTAAWNFGLKTIFEVTNNPERVVVCNNDVVLGPHLVRELLAYNLPFITGCIWPKV